MSQFNQNLFPFDPNAIKRMKKEQTEESQPHSSTDPKFLPGKKVKTKL